MIADRGVEKVVLVEGVEHGPADLGAVERLEAFSLKRKMYWLPHLLRLDQLDVVVGDHDLQQVMRSSSMMSISPFSSAATPSSSAD